MSSEIMRETFKVTRPEQLTQIVRDQISDGRRVVGVRNSQLLGRVTIETMPAHGNVFGEMGIPNQDKPHAIFESVAPPEI